MREFGTSDEQLLIASVIESGETQRLNFEVATRIFGFSEPTVYFEHRDRRQRKEPIIGFYKVRKSKSYWAGEYGSVVDFHGDPIRDKDGHKRPGKTLLKLPHFLSSQLAHHEVLDEMTARGYEFALARVGERWGASFHATTGPIAVQMFDSTTPGEAVAKAALRTLEVK